MLDHPPSLHLKVPFSFRENPWNRTFAVNYLKTLSILRGEYFPLFSCWERLAMLARNPFQTISGHPQHCQNFASWRHHPHRRVGGKMNSSHLTLNQRQDVVQQSQILLWDPARLSPDRTSSDLTMARNCQAQPHHLSRLDFPSRRVTTGTSQDYVESFAGVESGSRQDQSQTRLAAGRLHQCPMSCSCLNGPSH